LKPNISFDDDVAPSLVNKRPEKPENQAAQKGNIHSVSISMYGSSNRQLPNQRLIAAPFLFQMHLLLADKQA
jgi:hypothetical protein